MGNELQSFAAQAGGVLLTLLAVAMPGQRVVASQVNNPVEEDLSGRCKGLATAEFSAIQDAPTQVMEAKLIRAEGSALVYCRVKGYVSPNIGIKMGLPSPWNGRFIEMGCGGHCGVLDDDQHFLETSLLGCGAALRRGFACVESNMGHQGTGSDGLWGFHNLQAKMDWGFRATHVVALAGKAVAAYYYQSSAAKSYFMGCSTGGRQALQAAQRFPWDFDGIVAGAPPVDLATLYMTFLWGFRAAHDRSGSPLLSTRELRLLTEGALAKCDLDDGVKDGVIGDPLHCPFDPAELACRARQTTECLTPTQVDVAKKIYSGPMTSKGEKLSSGGPVVGSEVGLENSDFGWSISYLGDVGEFRGYPELAINGFRYLLLFPEPGPTWNPASFDFDRDYQRLGIMESLYGASNPDLRRFKAAGGKLLVYQGLNDNAVPPHSVVDYYETVQRTMGGRKETDSFVRLFLLPGVGHCAGGVGADAVDYLGALQAWVELDKAPDRLIAAHLTISDPLHPPTFPLEPSRVQFTRPVFPYPARAKYTGHGDRNDARSFSANDN